MNDLSDEHIIPLGLGGRWVLPKASCQNCAKITGAFEGTCLRSILGPLRMYYGLPSRRKRDRPEQLPLKVKLTANSDWSYINVDRTIYPFLILFPILNMPDELSGTITNGERGAKAKTFWIRGASFKEEMTPYLEKLAQHLNVAAIEPTAQFLVPEFFRMIAKIAHAFTVAELGIDAFTPFLLPIICQDETSNSAQYVGGLNANMPSTNNLHELDTVYSARQAADIVAAELRLLSILGTPLYYVVAGQLK